MASTLRKPTHGRPEGDPVALASRRFDCFIAAEAGMGLTGNTMTELNAEHQPPHGLEWAPSTKRIGEDPPSNS